MQDGGSDPGNLLVHPRFFGKNGLGSSGFLSWKLVSNFRHSGVAFTELKEAQEVWFFDLDPWFLIANLLRIRGKKKVLMVFEPQAVNPLQHVGWIQRRFEKVIAFDPEIALPESRLVLYFGHSSFPDGKIPNSTKTLRTNSVAIAAGDKQSASRSSQYHIRQRAITALLRRGYSVSLAGPHWRQSKSKRLKQVLQSIARVLASGNAPKWSQLAVANFLTKCERFENFRFHGWVESESEFFSGHQVVLVIENDSRFHSEKVYSAIASGSNVVYVGPERPWLAELPQVFFADPSISSITRSIDEALATPVTRHVARRFLAKYSLDKFYRRLALEIMNP
jgi:hypothetical protein